MCEIKNLDRAAEMLARFNYDYDGPDLNDRPPIYSAIVLSRTPEGNVARNSASIRPAAVRPHPFYEIPTDWREFVRSHAFIREDSGGLYAEEICSICISLWVGTHKEGNRRQYIVESTDLKNFDRICYLYSGTGTDAYQLAIKELILTQEESESIHGIEDAMKILDKVDSSRFREMNRYRMMVECKEWLLEWPWLAELYPADMPATWIRDLNEFSVKHGRLLWWQRDENGLTTLTAFLL